MNQLIESLKQRFKSGEMYIKLIMINVGFFVVTLLISILFKFGNSNFDLYPYYSASSDLSTSLMRPWTIITYMFGHSLDKFGHILSNMLVLYFGGKLFVQQLGNRKLLSVYLAGGIIGFVFFALGYNLIPSFQGTGTLVGASASVLAIFVAIGVYVPNLEIRFPLVSKPIKLIYIVGGYVVLNLIWLQSSIGVENGNTGGWIAHFGGIAFGAYYASKLKSGKNILSKFEKFLDKIFSGDFLSIFKTKKPKLKVKKGGNPKKKSTQPKKEEVKKTTDIEPILNKVKESGYSSLTSKEKELLFSQTKK